MKKLKLALTILVGVLLLLFVYGYSVSPTRDVLPVVATAQAIGVRPLAPYLTHVAREVTADSWSILVDLSDNANFPHANTNRIILKQLHLDGDLSAAKEWKVHIGVVTSVTTATTGIEWIHDTMRVRNAQFENSWDVPEHGLNLMVASATLPFVATNETLSTGVITSSTEISTAVGVTGTVGVGDLIMFTDEITDTANLRVTVNTVYDTE